MEFEETAELFFKNNSKVVDSAEIHTIISKRLVTKISSKLVMNSLELND